MTFKTLIAAAALSLSPALAFAACSDHSEQAMTCAAGSTYDADTNTCVTMSS